MSPRVVRWRFCSASKSMLRNFRSISTLEKTCWHQNTGISSMLVAVNFHEYCKIYNLMISYVLLIKSVITYLTSMNILNSWMDLTTKLTKNDVEIFLIKPKNILHVERFITSSLTNTFIHASKNTSSTQCQGNICPVLYCMICPCWIYDWANSLVSNYHSLTTTLVLGIQD